MSITVFTQRHVETLALGRAWEVSEHGYLEVHDKDDFLIAAFAPGWSHVIDNDPAGHREPK